MTSHGGGSGARLFAARRVLLTIPWLAVLAVAACHRPSGPVIDITVRQQITPQPVQIGLATVAIQLQNVAAQPVSRATIMVEADMTHPGMSPVFGAAKEIAPGSYQAHIDFNMGGDWVVLLHIHLADGEKIERQLNVANVRSN